MDEENKQGMMKWLLVFVFSGGFCIAQLPDTDIWLFELGKTKKGIIIKKGKNITDRPGYDNQPYFTPDNKNILYTSIREDKQADIYKYELSSKKIIQVTATKTSEYSPNYTPDGKSVSVVMVESDSTQRIWQFDAMQKKNKLVAEADEKILTAGTDSVGYYCWLNKDTLIYYKLTEPHSLRVLSLSTGNDVWLADSPTHAFKSYGGKKFFYVVKRAEGNEVRVYDLKIKRSDTITTAGKENENFIWDKNLGLIKSEKNKLMRYDEKLKMWLELGDFSGMGINKITRFAISPNGRWLAVVSNK
jgi:Tol biopolymer transport system component